MLLEVHVGAFTYKEWLSTGLVFKEQDWFIRQSIWNWNPFELLQNSIGKFTWSVYLIIYCYFQDPKIYVQTILDVHKKYHALVMTAFSNDSGFVAALDKVCDLNIDTFLGFVY